MAVIVPVPENPPPSIPIFTEIVLVQASISVFERPNQKILQFKAPNGIAFTVPLDPIGVENLIQALKGTNLSIARV